MLIKSLEIQGFKSFPDKTVLTFDRGITAIVGPNGSGKSNISDAVRWVLGEQSTKSLRGTKMEDVVFNGTAARRPQGYAEVSLSIDNKDRRLPFDGDEVRVTRRYYRSGDSEYMINGAAVRLKDVNELFMDTGLGRDGYSVIGQGKIADIVSGRSDDRREIFEEAAGISRYRYRKLEAERKLAQAQDNLLRLNDILMELENRVGPLGEQAEKAKQFLAYADEKKGLEIGLWLINIDRLGVALREQEEKLAVIQMQHEDVSAELAALERRIDDTYNQINACVAQIDAYRNTMAEHDRRRAELEGENAVSRNDIAHFTENIARVENEQRTAALSEKEVAAELAEKEGATAEEEKNAEQLRETIAGLEKQTAGQTEKLLGFSEQENALREELAVYVSALSDARTADATAESTMNEIRTRLSDARSEQEQAQAQARKLEEKIAETNDLLKDQQEQAQSLQNTVQGYSMRLDTQKKKMEERRTQADKLRLDAESERRRVKLLEDLERSFEGFAHSVKTVMQESTRGTLSGILGPVSRILKVPEQYAVAIETALGAAMQNIVCASESDAKRGIALLKQRDAGRATFLPLTSVKGNVLNEKGLDDAFGFVGMAHELVTCEPEYDQICRSLLGRVAVAEDLDSAVTIARQFGYRFRIVTLDGQVVNAGGSLTGGSLAKNSGLLSRVTQIEKARKQAENLSAKAEAAQQQLRVIQETVAADKAALTGAQSEWTTLQEDMIRTKSELERLQSLLENTLAAGEQRQQEQLSAQHRLEELELARKQAAEDLNATNARKEEAEGKMVRLAEEKEMLQTARDAVNGQIATLRLQVLSAEKNIEQLRQNMEELRRRSSDHEQKARACEAEKEELNRRIAEAEAQIAARNVQAEELKQKTLDAGAQIAAISDQRTKLEQQQSELRGNEREKNAVRENCARELARLEEQRDSRQKEFDDILRKLWEEYEMTQREARELAVPVENPAQAQRRLTELKSKIRALGAVNVAAIEEYKEVRERYDFLKGQLDDVEKSRKELADLIARLTDEMKKRFMERFDTINAAFGETFRDLFGGGTASLSLSDPENVLTSDIEITIQPQGKIITNIDALSGGEKSLAAIALYFAIIKVSPTPFCILDEIEAALDDVNVTRFAGYLRRMCPKTQYIAITHRRGTMEEADVLYGVTMQEKGVSKMLRLPISEVEEKLGIH